MRTLLLLLALTIPLFAQEPRVTVVAGTPDRMAGTIPLRVTVTNPRTNAISFALKVHEYDALAETGATLEGPDHWSCPGVPNCTFFTPLAGESEVAYDFTLRLPFRAGRVVVYAQLEWAEGMDWPSGFVTTPHLQLVMAKPFTVTTNADSGAGSLRDAILGAGADPVCVQLPCSIEFALEGSSTIAPLTPLPLVRGGDIAIDATTQRDTNPAGPDVELLGTSLHRGDGLLIESPRAAVRGLAIGGFPGSGIFFRPAVFNSAFTFERNFIGVDPTGTHAVPNGSRGITIEGGVVTDSAIRENVLSGNARSGIFITTGRNQFGPLVPVIRIENNRIGVAAASDAPIPNHASGIFLGPDSEWIRVENNVIAYNDHFGVAIARGGSRHVVVANRILRNRNSGIDLGLDGPDAQFVATLISASYDATTNTTVVRGTSGPRQTWLATYAMLYVSHDADAEGEQYLAEVNVPPAGEFEMRVSGDHRGKYATVVLKTVIDQLWTETGEFSRPIRVE